jgi:hypothetical protein
MTFFRALSSDLFSADESIGRTGHVCQCGKMNRFFVLQYNRTYSLYFILRFPLSPDEF